MKARRITLQVVAAATVALLALPASALAQTGSSGSAGLAARAKPPTATVSKTTCTQATPSSAKHCTQVQKLPLSALSSAQRSQRSGVLKARAAEPAAAAALPPAPDVCVNGNSAAPDRLDACADVVWDVQNTETTDGVTTVIGTFTFEDQQWTTYSATSQSWTHGLYVIGYTTGATGTLASGFSAQMYSGCYLATGICTASSLGNPDPQSVSVGPGSFQEFAWTEFDHGPSATTANSENILDPYLGVNWEIATNPPTGTVDTGELYGRCDTMATSTDGCVDEDFTPTETFAISQFGASAAMVQYAQMNMNAHWGLQGQGSPLLKLAASQGDGNRRIICDSSFTNLGTAIGGDYGDTDSCDEFPFAQTSESGALNGVTSGAQCAQATAVETNPGAPTEAAAWNAITITGTFNPAAACIRGHIPLSQNTGLGGAFGRDVQTDRLIQDDPFWVSITP